MIENIVSLGAVFRGQVNWRRAPAEYRGASRGVADLLRVRWKINVQGAGAPNRLKERSVRGSGKPERDASRVR